MNKVNEKSSLNMSMSKDISASQDTTTFSFQCG